MAAQQFDLCLAPGEACSIIFGLGYIENPQEEKWESPGVINKTKAEAMMARYADDAAFDSAMAALREYWTGLLSRFQASTGDEKTDRMVTLRSTPAFLPLSKASPLRGSSAARSTVSPSRIQRASAEDALLVFVFLFT